MVKIFFLIFFIFQLAQDGSAESILKSYLGGVSQYQEITVKEVLSADVIRLENEEKIKLIGLKAPEPPARAKIERDDKGFVLKKEGILLKNLEQQSLDFAQELMEGKKVRLEFDIRQNGPDGTPAYVFLCEDNFFVNAEILRQGFAHLQISPPNRKYEQQLREAAQEARRERRGLQGD